MDGSRTRPDDVWLRRALLAWIILAVAVSVKVAVQPYSHTVYPVFASGALHWWADAPLYDDYDEQGLDLFRYSPTFAIAVTPFAVLPDVVGGMLWNLAGIAVLVWSLRMLVRHVLPGQWPAWREGVFLGLTLVLSVRGIWSGQNNTFLLGAAILGIVAISRKRWWTAALLLAIPVFIKIWPLALVLLLMACWPRQLIGRFLAACGLFATIPLLTRPLGVVVDQYHHWYLMLVNTRQTRWPGYRDAWTIWENLFPPVNANVYLALQLATPLAVLGWCLWQKRRTSSDGELLMLILSMWVCWQLLLGPGSERLTYIIVAPAVSWAVLVSYAEKRGRLASSIAWLMCGLLGTGGVERALLPYYSAAPVILPLGVVLLVAWLIWYQRGPALDVKPIGNTLSHG